MRDLQVEANVRKRPIYKNNDPLPRRATSSRLQNYIKNNIQQKNNEKNSMAELYIYVSSIKNEDTRKELLLKSEKGECRRRRVETERGKGEGLSGEVVGCCVLNKTKNRNKSHCQNVWVIEVSSFLSVPMRKFKDFLCIFARRKL